MAVCVRGIKRILQKQRFNGVRVFVSAEVQQEGEVCSRGGQRALDDFQKRRQRQDRLTDFYLVCHRQDFTNAYKKIKYTKYFIF